MYRSYRSTYERACDCRCPIHHGQPRLTYLEPGCHCRITCASQPMTLLAPQIGAALFLNYHGALWSVPGLQPGHWDWRYAQPVDTDHPLYDIADFIAEFFRETHKELIPLTHRM